MPRSRLSSSAATASVAIVATFALAIPRTAEAHFILMQPPASQVQDSAGSPQKQGPCGSETTPVPTNVVTTYEEGQTITIEVDQTVPHGGHWRVSLGMTGPASLPPEPAVTAITTGPVAQQTPCGTAVIENPPVFPVIGDDLLDQPPPGATGNASFQVTLPPGVTCTNCTLQVIEFMTQHGLNNPGGCYYHHCAQINIVASEGGTSSASSTSDRSTSSVAGGSSTPAGSSGSTATGASTGSAGSSPTGSGGSSAGKSSSGGGGNATSSGGTAAGEASGAEADGGTHGSDMGGGCSAAVVGSSPSATIGFLGLFGLGALLRRPRRRQ